MKQGVPSSWEWPVDPELMPGGSRHTELQAALRQVVSSDVTIDAPLVARRKLFAGGTAGEHYRLRITRHNKLILTK
jgi:hemin uptake protein HemP